MFAVRDVGKIAMIGKVPDPSVEKVGPFSNVRAARPPLPMNFPSHVGCVTKNLIDIELFRRVITKRRCEALTVRIPQSRVPELRQSVAAITPEPVAWGTIGPPVHTLAAATVVFILRLYDKMCSKNHLISRTHVCGGWRKTRRDTPALRRTVIVSD